jgi:methionyl-tRNA synthetase
MWQVSRETGSKVEWTEEQNYRFRLSAFREPLIEWLSASNGSALPFTTQGLELNLGE